MPVLGEFNGKEISIEKVNDIKSGNAPGLNKFVVECLKKSGMAILEWLVRLLNINYEMGV